MGGKDWMSRKKNTAAPAVRRLIQSFTREETDQTRGVRGTVIHNRIVKFVDRKELAVQLVKLSARGLQVGIHEFRRDIDLRNAGLVSKKALVKVLAGGSISTAVEVHADAFSKKAEEAIVAAGGKAIKPEK